MQEEAQSVINQLKTRITTLSSPLSGTVIPLKDVKDETFAEGYLGEGVAILPEDGHVYSPISGRVVSLFDTKHAVSIQGDNGAEVLIHVGRDTVSLGGRYFTAFCENGDRVRAGDLLLGFDLDAIDKEGFDLTTPIVIVNSTHFDSLEVLKKESVVAGEPLLRLHEGDKTLL